MRNFKAIILALLLVGFVGLGLHNITKTDNKIRFQDVQLKSTTSDLIQLQLKYDLLNKNLENELDAKTQNKSEIDKLEQQKKDLEKQRDDLQAQLQARAEQKAAQAQKLASAASLSGTAYAASGNFYKDYIYQHESHNNPNAVNSIGCRGLGQACPGSKLPCGNDYACQDAWFTQYAIGRYGSWQNAYYHWLQFSWW